MTKLAITIADASGVAELIGAQLHLQHAGAQSLIAGLGDSVGFCRPDRSDGFNWFAVARLIAVEPEPGGAARLLAKFSDLVYFPQLVPLSVADTKRAMGPPVWPLSEPAFARIIIAGGLLSGPAARISEGPQALLSPPSGNSLSAAFAAEVLAAYGNRCAFTGASHAHATPRHQLDIVAIRPIENGGTELPHNFIAAARLPALAFAAGHLTIGKRHEFICALDRLNPELLEALNPLGRLTLPEDPRHAPDPAALEYHNARIFNRLR